MLSCLDGAASARVPPMLTVTVPMECITDQHLDLGRPARGPVVRSERDDELH